MIKLKDIQITWNIRNKTVGYVSETMLLCLCIIFLGEMYCLDVINPDLDETWNKENNKNKKNNAEEKVYLPQFIESELSTDLIVCSVLRVPCSKTGTITLKRRQEDRKCLFVKVTFLEHNFYILLTSHTKAERLTNTVCI